MEIHLFENADPRAPRAGGVLCTWPSGARKVISWVHQRAIVGPDVLAMAKRCAAAALQSCLNEHRLDDAERTNWTSATAAIAAHVRTWSSRLPASMPQDEGIKPELAIPERARMVFMLGAALGTAQFALDALQLEGGGPRGEGPNSEEGVTQSGAPSHQTASQLSEIPESLQESANSEQQAASPLSFEQAKSDLLENFARENPEIPQVQAD